MATVGTSTQSDLLAPPTSPAITRDMSTGGLKDTMYTVVRTAADTLTVYRSTNEGVSWGSFSTVTHTGLQEWSSAVADRSGWLHIAYRVGTGTADTVWYRRMNCNTGAWTAAVQTSGTDPNSGTIGSRWQGVDLAVAKHSNGYSIAVCGAYTNGTSQYGMVVMGVSIDASSTPTITNKNSIIVGNRFFLDSGTAPGRSGVSCETEHNGDGFTADSPNLWVTWGRTKLRMVKLAWQGTTWSGPSAYISVRASMAAHDFVGGRWDGTQWVMAIMSPDDATVVRLYQRNQANTLTVSYDTPTHPTGNIRAMATSYDNTNKNIRVFAVGTSTSVLYYVDYNRAASTWGTWTSVTATAIGPSYPEWSVRRGGSADNAKIDVITAASGSPNTVTHTAMATITAPSVATWISPISRYNGGPADIANGLLLEWNFRDSDPGQTQGSYALSRQIGAGTVQYWRASDSTWQASEVQNSSTIAQVTLPGGWGVDSDAAYTYKVKVWDSGGLPASGYSAPYAVMPSAAVNPTVTAPTGGTTITTDRVTVTWTVSQQTSYRVVLRTNPGSQVVYTSGWIAGAVTSYTVPTSMANGTAWTVTLETTNTEGLQSAVQSRDFTVQYTPSPVPYSQLTPLPASGYIRAESLAPLIVGAQPAISSIDLYRRPTVPTLNANASFAGNTTGWSSGGGGSGTLSYSTTQFVPYSSPGAGRLVPNGGATDPQIESALYTATAGKVYIASGWIRPDAATRPIFIAINLYNSSNTYLTSFSTKVSPPVALAWQYMEVIVDPGQTANAAKLTVGLGVSSSPVAADAFYVDEARLREYPNDDKALRIAAALNHPADVHDWGAASGVDYEYRWVAVGGNGTAIAGPWQS